jgi:DNA-binding transcriptional ArsR family regulator
MGDAGLTEEDGSLTAEVVETLRPGLRDALNHPARRDILRAVQGRKGSRAVGEMVAELPPLKRAEVSYHVTVLRDLGCIEARGTRPGPVAVARARIFGSCIAGDRRTQLILGATEGGDKEHRRRLARRESPGTLAMFRVPGPAIAIRLLNRGRTQGQNG